MLSDPNCCEAGKKRQLPFHFSDGTVVPSEGLTVDVRTSGEIFRRTGLVQKIYSPFVSDAQS